MSLSDLSFRVGSLVAAVEHGVLGRGRPCVDAALGECLALVSGGSWCARCGALAGNPRLPGRPVMPVPSTTGQCRNCHGKGPFQMFVRLGRYEPPLDRLVRRVKEEPWHAMAHEMGVRLGGQVACTLTRPPQGWVVVPIPADPWRRLSRGIDHAHAISRGLAAAVSGRVIRALRVRHGLRQASMDRSHRWARANRFRLRRGVRDSLRDQSVLLVDDVRTTGATLENARELLSRAGAQAVSAAVVCVADRHKT